MAVLRDLLLPPVKSTASTCYDHSNDQWFKQRFSSSSESDSSSSSSSSSILLLANNKSVVQIPPPPPPPYTKRQGFIPRKPDDFGDGGAFPEIHHHVAHHQYPLGMGRRKGEKLGSSKTLPPTLDAIVKQNENSSSKIVYSQHKDLVPRGGDYGHVEEDEEEMEKEIEETMQSTKAALEKKIVNTKKIRLPSSDSEFIKYTPSLQRSSAAAFNSGAEERIIRMVEMPVDPLEPPKFKHKRVPKASSGSPPPPVPVMHSPPRPVTVKDQQDWKIPPCISNWKNPKGYTIPLDKRLAAAAADGRGGLQEEVQINDKFAKLPEALHVAEQKAREDVAMRSKVQKEMLLKEKERKEQELRALAQKARSERNGNGVLPPPPAAVPMSSDRSMSDAGDDARGDCERRVRDNEREGLKEETREEREERLQREKIREERRRERERERRLEAAKDAVVGKKSKITRDRYRDVSEKVALGMASTGGAGHGGGEVMYDQRLFNQEKGMDSGFVTDDQYNVYDKGLLTAQSAMNSLYKPRRDNDEEMYGGADEQQQLDKVLKTERFKPDNKFSGAPDKAAPRDRPVEFEEPAEEADPFGLDLFWTEVKKGKKAMDKVGSGGTMKASAGSSMRDGNDGGGSSRTRIGFERGR